MRDDEDDDWFLGMGQADDDLPATRAKARGLSFRLTRLERDLAEYHEEIEADLTRHDRALQVTAAATSIAICAVGGVAAYWLADKSLESGETVTQLLTGIGMFAAGTLFGRKFDKVMTRVRPAPWWRGRRN